MAGEPIRASIETEYAQRNSALITCTEKENPTVIQGFEKTIALVNHHGIDLLPTTSNALNAMQQAADADGIQLELLLGFLEHPILETLFDCGPEGTCQCNACNVTPYPGYSPHQAGTAVALRVDPPEVLEWLEIHGGTNMAFRSRLSENPGVGCTTEKPPSSVPVSPEPKVVCFRRQVDWGVQGSGPFQSSVASFPTVRFNMWANPRLHWPELHGPVSLRIRKESGTGW